MGVGELDDKARDGNAVSALCEKLTVFFMTAGPWLELLLGLGTTLGERLLIVIGVPIRIDPGLTAPLLRRDSISSGMISTIWGLLLLLLPPLPPGFAEAGICSTPDMAGPLATAASGPIEPLPPSRDAGE